MEKNYTYQKIKSLDELVDIVQRLKQKGKKIAQCHGVFDLLHPGHIRHFEAAKREGDVVIVTITKDRFVNKGPGRPVFNQRLRAESIAALECVDYVAINEWPTATNTIKKLKPDVYVKGSDYLDRKKDVTGEIYNEEAAIRSVGGRLHFTDEISFSSTKLLNIHFRVYPEETDEFLKDFRAKYSGDDIIKYLKDLNSMRVLVIGDTIIDEYHYCTAMGKSPKENIIPTRYLSQETFAGGVLAAANHIAGFCKEVHLVTCLGTENNYKDFIETHLKPNIKRKFFFREDAPTTVKRRFVEPAFLSKLFEVCFLNDHPLPEKIRKQACRYLEKITKNFDLLLVADFGHGFIEKEIVEVVTKKARFLAVNTQTNSANIGFNLITKYPKVDYICVDEPEMRLASHSKFDDIEDLILSLKKRIGYKKIIVTLGHKGSIGYSKKEGFSKIPVFSKEVIDRVGAGDAFLSITAPCAAAGYPMEVVGFIGNAVGAMKVLIVGNRSSVEPAPLFKFIATLLK